MAPSLIWPGRSPNPASDYPRSMLIGRAHLAKSRPMIQRFDNTDVVRAARLQGWSVVWVAFTVAAFGFGIGFYGPAVFLHTLHTTKDWPIATISAAITAHFLLGAAIVIGLPEIYRALGIANTTILGAFLSVVGILAWSSATVPWHMFLAAILSGGGWAVMSGAAINAMIAPWFDQDRPKALSHAFNGASIGGVVFTPLLVWLIARLGFQSAAIVVGLTMLLVVGTLAHLYLRRGPEDFGVTADGRPIGAVTVPVDDTGRLPRTALIKSRQFATISIAFACALFAQVGVLSHLLARLSPEMGTGGGAGAMSLTMISAVAGRMLLARCIGDYDRRYAAAANFLVQSGGVGLLCIGSGTPALLIGCILFGLGLGNAVTLPAMIAQKEFRSADVGTVVALVVAINQAVFALAPAILGGLREVSANYLLSFGLAAAVQVIAAVIVVVGARRTSGSMDNS
jgi:MFS family permease